MAEMDVHHGARQHLSILRRHVLGPVSTALDDAKRERTEVASERDAFDEFETRVARLPPVTAELPALPLGAEADAAGGRRTADLRRAYEETVMAVDHYDEVYGESLDSNVAAEFGPALVELFDPGSAATLSAHQRDLLAGAAAKRARERDEFCTLLDDELASLRATRRRLADLLATLDSSVVPAWYRDEFESRVDSIHGARQAALYDRSMPSGYDSHTLCAYLYDDEPWTYPGLTAVARLLDSIAFRDE